MPQAAPMMALSLMGVSITRSQPNFSSNPSLVLNAPPYTPTSSPISTTRGSAAISSNSACLIASRKVMGAIATSSPFRAPLISRQLFFLATVFAAGFGSFFIGVLALAAGLSPLQGFRESAPCRQNESAQFSREELFPRPKPSTVQTGSTLDFGGSNSLTSRSHFGCRSWHSGPVQ